MPVDNHKKIAAFLPEEEDDDTFFYTEILDRRHHKGSNQFRTLKTFYHRSQMHFATQWETIKKLCDDTGARAYTRLSPRSYEQVGRAYTQLVVSAAMNVQWRSMPRLYASACGLTPIKGRKLWLFDIDLPGSVDALALEERLGGHGLDVLVTSVPSRKGHHLIVRPHHVDYRHDGIELHKDNPTNLYIPDSEEVT
jgi:hypothetical protein